MRGRSEEDYLKAIYEIQSRQNRGARVSEVAAALGVSVASASEMLGRLAREGLVERKKYGAVSLTGKGIEKAGGMVRKHRLLEVFFERLLGLKKEFHREAHALEHALSEEASERLARLLGNPRRCPDGDIIPAQSATVLTLDRARPGGSYRMVFSSLERKEDAARLVALGLLPGEMVGVERAVRGGPLIIRLKGAPIALGRDVCAKIFVEAVDEGVRRMRRAQRRRHRAGR
ncbi:MAG: metal-dependent transcriptional regulator [Candidatus Micrarchaeia archaeon]